MIAPGHSQVTENELREEGQVESDEGDQRSQLGPALRIRPASHLGPPEMQSSYIGHHHATDHYVMEMSNHKVGVVNMDISAKRCQEQTCKPANGEQPDEADGVQHRRFKADFALVHGGRPVEDLDRRRNSNGETQQRKDHGGVNRDASDEHVVRPNHEPEYGNGDAGEGDKEISKHPLA